MIAIVDTGGANHASVQNAIQRLGGESRVSLERAEIERAERVILPGVGHAAYAMRRLREADLIEPLRALTQPVLGICLGMQILFESSEEGEAEGLGVLPGAVRALRATPEDRVPHMGWNQLAAAAEPSPLLQGIGADEWFYFVHSFACPQGAWTQAVTRDAREIPAVASIRNFAGVQFHPERSGLAGARLLANFLGATR